MLITIDIIIIKGYNDSTAILSIVLVFLLVILLNDSNTH